MRTILVERYLRDRRISEAEFDALTQGSEPVRHEVGQYGSWRSHLHPREKGAVVVMSTEKDWRGDVTAFFVSRSPVWAAPSP